MPMNVVPKWKVTVVYLDNKIVFWISESFSANVLRSIADLQFTENGLIEPISIQIERVGNG